MCSLLRFCVRLSWSALASAWPSMPVHSELSVPRLYSKRRQSSNAATTSSAHFHDQCLALPIRFQSQPDCPTAPMPLLCPRLRCALTELHCASSLRRGDPLPTCTCPSQQGAGHCPDLDLKDQRQHHLLVPDSIGNKGARPCLAPGTRPRPPPRPPLPPRLPNDSLALTLTLTLP